MSDEDANGGACVLVVDDDEDIRETLREAIEMIGCSVMTAANGADALRLLETSRPCLIILDLIMPVMTGVEMIEAMKQRPALSDVPVLISSSAPNRAPAGFPILPKPIDIDRFWARVEEMCTCVRPRAKSRVSL
jgi:CheY-like chemotaxis protein